MSDEVDDAGDADEFDDEIAPEGNRISGGRTRAVVEHIARHLVDDPDAIDIAVEERRSGDITVIVHAGPGDVGRLIGKRGRVVQAIRQVARAAAAAEGVRATVDVAD
ncbi:MAG TPA: KH domain-containing protein [Acidimicrobiia bacterium]|jgi:hypothetical protein|nr:KH domain-containing protein [Acidimicrobiia bacterium]